VRERYTVFAMATSHQTLRDPQLKDQRGLAKQLKRVLPRTYVRALGRAYNAAMSAIPDVPKYAIGTHFRRRKIPYQFIEADDVIVQVGAPRDLLAAGRSRAVHFARIATRGRVVVVEPDPENCRALREFIERHDLAARLTLFPCGAWSENTDLVLLSSPNHPASNRLDALVELPDDVIQSRQYQRVTVPVKTVDTILEEAGLELPKLVSITTNGAEQPILAGMKTTIAAGCPYISLAGQGEGHVAAMARLGYEYFARDDRGCCFRRK